MQSLTTLFGRRLRTSTLALCLSFSSLAFISGCETIAIATVAIATVDIIHDRRTVGEYIDDSAIEVQFQTHMKSTKRLRSEAHINGISWNGILLLTGEVHTEEMKQEVVAFANSIKPVRQVVDETHISGKTGFLARTSDSWLTTKVKTKLTAKMGADANRVKVVSERGNVYLMGIVTEDEAFRATEAARSVRGVARVIKVFEYKT
ncbi:MAG: BON domain-containing protein [Arenicella sp.]